MQHRVSHFESVVSAVATPQAKQRQGKQATTRPNRATVARATTATAARRPRAGLTQKLRATPDGARAQDAPVCKPKPPPCPTNRPAQTNAPDQGVRAAFPCRPPAQPCGCPLYAPSATRRHNRAGREPLRAAERGQRVSACRADNCCPGLRATAATAHRKVHQPHARPCGAGDPKTGVARMAKPGWPPARMEHFSWHRYCFSWEAACGNGAGELADMFRANPLLETFYAMDDPRLHRPSFRL